jgi:hypothetical protein
VSDSGTRGRGFRHRIETLDRLISKMQDLLQFGMMSKLVGRDLVDEEREQQRG